MHLTESEIAQLIYDLEVDREKPRTERSIGLDFDEINYILNLIKTVR